MYFTIFMLQLLPMTILMILFAKYLYIFVILIAGIYFLLQKRPIQKHLGLFAVISLAASFIVGQIASKLYYNPRPFVAHHFKPLVDHAVTNGFPSDHALLCFTIAAIIFFFNKKLGLILGV